MLCIGYLDAVADLVLASGHRVAGVAVCPKGFVKDGDLRSMVSKYLEEHPEQLNLAGPDVVIKTLEKAFPCG